MLPTSGSGRAATESSASSLTLASLSTLRAPTSSVRCFPIFSILWLQRHDGTFCAPRAPLMSALRAKRKAPTTRPEISHT